MALPLERFRKDKKPGEEQMPTANRWHLAQVTKDRGYRQVSTWESDSSLRPSTCRAINAIWIFISIKKILIVI